MMKSGWKKIGCSCFLFLVLIHAPVRHGQAELWIGYKQIVGGLSKEAGSKGVDSGAIELDIPFRLNSDRLSSKATRQLNELAKAVKSRSLRDAVLEIAGHTDAAGKAAYNKKLSLRRAKTIKRFLVDKHDVDPGRLETIGWGEERLKDPEKPRSAVNRRVEIRKLSNDDDRDDDRDRDRDWDDRDRDQGRDRDRDRDDRDRDDRDRDRDDRDDDKGKKRGRGSSGSSFQW